MSQQKLDALLKWFYKTLYLDFNVIALPVNYSKLIWLYDNLIPNQQPLNEVGINLTLLNHNLPSLFLLSLQIYSFSQVQVS